MDLADKLQRETARRGATFASLVITNGALLTREVAERLVAVGVTRVQVTLDGPAAIHDQRRPMRGGQPTFDKILRNLKAIKGLIDVVIRVNLDEGNRAHVPELARLLADEGLLSGDRAMTLYTAKLTVYTEQVRMAWKPLNQSDLPALDDASTDALAPRAPDRREAIGSPQRPRTGSCSAMVNNSFVIGPRGHLFKCELGIHDVREAVGSVHPPQAEAPGPRRRLLPLAASGTGERGVARTTGGRTIRSTT